jgi:glycosyltransferase involved in cell wall biosynthesis
MKTIVGNGASTLAGTNDKVRGVSVAICCHNGAERLPSTLAATLAAVKSDRPNDCELIVVDNGSSDGTIRLAEAHFSQETQIECRIIKEPRLGLAYARLAALSVAKGNVTCFIDDDNWPSSEYFSTVRRVFNQNPSVGIFGCSTRLPDGISLPPELSQFGESYAIGHLHPISGLLPAGWWVWGAGLAVRTEAARCLAQGGFQSAILFRGGDETELSLAVCLLGWRVWYEKAPLIIHAVDERRFTVSNLLKMHQGFGASALVIRRYVRRAQGQNWISGRVYPLLALLHAPIAVCRAAYRILMIYVDPSLERQLKAAESRGWMRFLVKGWGALSVQRHNLKIIERHLLTVPDKNTSV